MTSIINIGMDVHSTNYTMCAYTFAGQQAFGRTVLNPDINEVVKYLKKLDEQLGGGCEFVCGYEAGCLGYSLYRQLTAKGIHCVILAPTTMPDSPKGKGIKTDKRDALKIAQCLTYGTYSAVQVPTPGDDSVKEYIRMRDDAKTLLKQTKQQINALCVRHGRLYAGGKWTAKHIQWLKSQHFEQVVLAETLQEYLLTWERLTEKIARFDRRIEELAQSPAYYEKVRKLGCLKGIATHTALSLVVEIGDFNRFPTAQQFSSFLGLVPGERSSAENQNRLSITKAGNSHLRLLLTESANTYSKGMPGIKSRALKSRQNNMPPKVVAYADKASVRLRKKYIRISSRSNGNITKVAVARELACFVWGIMTGKIS